MFQNVPVGAGIVPGTEDGPVLSGKGLIWGRIELYWGRALKEPSSSQLGAIGDFLVKS